MSQHAANTDIERKRFRGDPVARRCRIQAALRRRHGYALVGVDIDWEMSDEAPVAIGAGCVAQAIWGIGFLYTAEAFCFMFGESNETADEATHRALDRLLARIVARHAEERMRQHSAGSP